ncbi:MAG TPA: hypothetical protein VK689_06840, partial [Armatimonadota bacterium]|nr:hypothetical protein [Armatimonadota bacterium]
MRDLAGRAVGTGRRKRPVLWAGVLLALVAPLATSVLALAADDFDDAPIGYATARPADPIARLQERIDRGEVTLKRDARRGYL